MLKVSESYIIGVDISDTGDTPVLTVSRLEGSKMTVVNSFMGEEAKWMYERLTHPKETQSTNNLRWIFSEQGREQTRQQIEAINARAEAEQWCSTCEHYIPVDPYLPGFVTAFPECTFGGLAIKHCGKYKKKEPGGDENA